MRKILASFEQALEQPIFVLGLPRSGTSMVAGILELCGAWLGRTVPGGGTENPKGFFENIYLRECVTKKILADTGFDPLGVSSLPFFDQLPNINGLKQTISDYLQHEAYPGTTPWLYKDAKLTLLWPLFMAEFPAARWVIVRRDHDEVIRSCLRTPFMSQHSSDEAFWRTWIKAYELRLTALKQTTNNWREISSADLINGNLDQAMEIAIWAGLRWKDERVREFITPQYWHLASQSH